jgi:endogenous inhibitor of DNA gyrase (YacG/DUF329 family)
LVVTYLSRQCSDWQLREWLSGNDAIEGRAKATADVIAEQIKI